MAQRISGLILFTVLTVLILVVMVAEGDAELTVHLARSDHDERIPLSVTLIPVDQDRRSRVHATPPFRGPVVFRHLPPGEWRLEVQFAGEDAPVSGGDPISVGAGSQEQTVRLSP